MKARKKAFTLAEVLITLTIIGVIASMTIPALVNNINNKTYKTAFADATNAWNQMVYNDQIQTRISSYSGGMVSNDFPNFKTYFQIIKDCNSSNAGDCWELENGSEQFNNNRPINSNKAFLDNSGRSWCYLEDTFIPGAAILVDTNGFKSPNEFGKDRFIFWSVPSVCTTADVHIYHLRDTATCVQNIIPKKLIPSRDILSGPCWYCNSPPCYNETWLKE